MGDGTPRNFGPCGVVLDRGEKQLFVRPERHYPYLEPITPPLEEVLLTPFFVKGNAVGTVWLVSHDPAHKFDSEDVRLIQSLGNFASAAYQVLERAGALEGDFNALHDREGRLREIIDALPVAIYTTDHEGRLTHFNKAAVEFSGRVPELGTDHWCVSWKLFHPDGNPMPHDECPMAVTLKEGRPVRGAEAILERPDGSRAFFIPYPSLLRNAQGQVTGGINMLLDITERKQNEDVNARLAAIIESSDDAIISKDLNSVITSWNRGAETIFGYAAEETVGRPITMLMPPDRVNEEPRILERLRRGEKIDHYETVRRRKDGTLLDISLSVSPIMAGGKVIGASKIARDVTHRKKAEQRLHLLWETAAILLSANDDPDAMMRRLFAKVSEHLGVDTYFNFMANQNGDALRLVSCTGIPEEIAQSIERLEFGQAICGAVDLCRSPIIASNIQQSSDPMHQLVKSFGIKSYACNPLLAENRLIGTLWFASRTKERFPPDEVALIETICHYVTMAHERLRLVEELRDAQRRKDEFLAMLAHELRNPLAPVRNALQLLGLAGGNLDLVEQSRAIIERQVSQIVRLVDDLLDVARITRGHLELRKECLDLAEVVKSALETSRPLIEQMEHDLTLSLPFQEVHVYADPVRLSQVIANLLNNAAKYTERGGRIWLTAERQGLEAVVTVNDTGIGLEADKIPCIFDIFTQIDPSQDRSHGGLGLGLTLVKRLIEMHGGSVDARSEGPGKGSKFTLRIPTVPAPARKPSAPPSEEAKASRQRVLVVDDNRDGADSLSLMLTLLDNHVQTAYDGLEAIQAAEVFRPEVVLLDIGLPKLNGFEVCHHIRQQSWGKGMVLIAVTGWGQEQDRLRSASVGFNSHLVKPVNRADLEKVLAGLGTACG